VWQLNDCWPTVSWAIADYFLVRKPAFYAIKRALEPVTIGVTRKFHGWTTRPADGLWRRDTGHVNPLEAFTDISFDVWVASSLRQIELGQVVVRFVSVATGRDVKESRGEEVEVRPNSCTDVLVDFKFSESGKEPERNQGSQTRHFDPFIIHASLYIGGKHIASDTSWPDPIKYLDFSDRNIRVQRIEADVVSVSAEKPVKGFVFSEKQGVGLSDNGFDLIPGEPPTKVQVQGADPDSLTWNYIGQ
jgi:beta-mannosidase